jgi:hypothetical protein
VRKVNPWPRYPPLVLRLIVFDSFLPRSFTPPRADRDAVSNGEVSTLDPQLLQVMRLFERIHAND